MKRNLTRWLAGLAVLTLPGVEARILTVSDSTSSPAEYSNLQEAINAAGDGDTIYIHSYTYSAPAINVDRRLTFIGGGYSGLNFSIKYTAANRNASGSRFLGVAGVFDVCPSDSTGVLSPVTGLTFERCRMRGLNIRGSSMLVRNCFIDQVNWFYGDGHVLANNIIGWIGNRYLNYPTGGGHNRLLTNNIILQQIVRTNGLNLVNNMFMLEGDPIVGVADCTITHNLFVGASASASPDAGNVLSMDPLFRAPHPGGMWDGYNETVLGTFISSTTCDLHLGPGSPAIGTASDGGDMGIYGGPYPWPDNDTGAGGRYSLPTPYPRMEALNILNSSIPVGGMLKVQVKARKGQP